MKTRFFLLGLVPLIFSYDAVAVGPITGGNAVTGTSLALNGQATGELLRVKGTDNDAATNIAAFYANNQSLGIGLYYSGFRALGSAADVDLRFFEKGAGGIYFGVNSKFYFADSTGFAYLNGLRVSGADASNTIYNSGGNVGITAGGSALGIHVASSNGALTLDGLLATAAAAPTIESATTIAPTKPITFISGTTSITTITAPAPISSGGGQITLIPTGIFTTTIAGNIALSSTATVSKPLIMTYDVTTAKWYPSY